MVDQVENLRADWDLLQQSLTGQRRDEISDETIALFEALINRAAMGPDRELEAELRLNWCFIILIPRLPDATLTADLEKHFKRLDEILEGIPDDICPNTSPLRLGACHVQSILHLVKGDRTRAEEAWARWWDNADRGFRLSLDRIRFNEQWNAVSRALQKEVSVEGLELARWLASERNHIDKRDMLTIGDYVTNDALFHARVWELIRDLQGRLRPEREKLQKPENYVLRGDPGSGKSFLVKQIAEQLEGARLIEHTLAGGCPIEEAASNALMDVVTHLRTDPIVVLFLDEADTSLRGEHLFQRWIAPMNGEEFVLHGRQMSFKKVNLVMFYAMSSEEQKWRASGQTPQKWEDFRRRVPERNWFEPPPINASPGERVFRGIGLLGKLRNTVRYAQANALFYLGWREWESTRAMEQALREAVNRIPESRNRLELADLRPTAAELDELGRKCRGLIEELGHKGGLWTFGHGRQIAISAR